MAETTGIAWTRSTFNPWIGCTEVSVSAPDGDTTKGGGCDDCYARALDARHRWGGDTHWGHGKPRMRTAAAYWRQAHRWNELAKAELYTGRLTPKSAWKGRIGFWPVFCASLADIFDNEVDHQWREDLWQLILDTPFLTWQLVTKRVGNVMEMIPDEWLGKLPTNIWIIATTVNQYEFDRDWSKLREIPAIVRGLSLEPMLGDIEYSDDVRGYLHWAIYGGESKQSKRTPRECRLYWIEKGIAQCRALGVAPFVKQAGNICTDGVKLAGGAVEYIQVGWGSGKRDNPAHWPAQIRVQEFPT